MILLIRFPEPLSNAVANRSVQANDDIYAKSKSYARARKYNVTYLFFRNFTEINWMTG
jgi:hypothetical protein